MLAESTEESTQSNTQFQEWKDQRKWAYVHPPKVIVNKQCTHCAIVWRAWENVTRTVSILQQLWSLSTSSQLEWSYISRDRIFGDDSPKFIAPAFSSDSRYVGFGDLSDENLVHLVAIPPGDARRSEQLRLQRKGKVNIELLAISPDAKRLCVISDYPIDCQEGISLATFEHSGRKIDIIAGRGNSIAIHYSKCGNVLYSLNIDVSNSPYRLYKFNLTERNGQIRALPSIEYQPPFGDNNYLLYRSHSSVYDLGSSASGLVFEYHAYLVSSRKFGISLSREQKSKKVLVVNIPFQESRDVKHRFLSNHENFMMSDGKFLIVDMLEDRGRVLELDNELFGSNEQTVATFSMQPMPSGLIVGYRDGRLYFVDKKAGYFTVVKTKVIELADRTDLRRFPFS